MRQGTVFDDDTPFSDLGMDSLATASIAADLEERVGMTILPELLFDYGSVTKLAAFIDSQAGRGATGTAG
jgi:acyl carrier protein